MNFSYCWGQGNPIITSLDLGRGGFDLVVLVGGRGCDDWGLSGTGGFKNDAAAFSISCCINRVNVGSRRSVESSASESYTQRGRLERSSSDGVAGGLFWGSSSSEEVQMKGDVSSRGGGWIGIHGLGSYEEFDDESEEMLMISGLGFMVAAE